MSAHGASRDLPQRARAALGEDFARACRIRAAVYWPDLILSAATGWALFCASVATRERALIYALFTGGAILAQLRALVFLHEIAHGRRLRSFEIVWNLLVGIPLAVPSLLYVGSHPEHHRVDRFASDADPEYVAIRGWRPLRRAGFVASGALVPLLLVLRWGVLAPLGLVSGRVRSFALERCSTLAINPRYRRGAGSRPGRWRWRLLEPACTAWVGAAAGAALAGAIPVFWVVQWCAVVGGVFAVNQLRTLVAHGYANPGSRVDLAGQLADSINLASHPVTAGIAPLGLRHHALHHLLPELPYHSLGWVHRELVRRLPAESAYRRAGPRGLVRALAAALLRGRVGSGSSPAPVPPMKPHGGAQAWTWTRASSGRSSRRGATSPRSRSRRASRRTAMR